MSNRRPVHADILARLLFKKPLDHLSRRERAALDFLRGLPSHGMNAGQSDKGAAQRGDRTLH
jgi:hypothetical protein